MWSMARAALYTVLSLLMFLVESLFPPLFPFAPYIKPGLSNIFLLLALLTLGTGRTLLILCAKCLLAALFTSFFSVYYSLGAGLAAMLVMAGLLHVSRFRCGIVTVSMAGAAVHNAVQLILYALLTRTGDIALMIPFSVPQSMVTGALVGITCFLIVRTEPAKPLCGLQS